MKLLAKKRFAFIGKSLLWSLMLYVAFMVTINWDEVSNTVSGNNPITVINQTLPDAPPPGINSPVTTPTNINTHSVIVKGIIAVVKAVSGFSGH